MARLTLLAAILVSLAAACGGDDDGTASPAESPTVNRGLPSVKLQRVFPNLSFKRLTGMYQAPDGRWFVTEQAGRITAITPNVPNAAAAEILDITDRVSTAGNEEGLLGFAFAPDFTQSRAFYVYYSAANPRRSVISRFIANAASGTAAAPGSEMVLLEIAQPFSNHNGGQMVFGSDGYLYIGLGDGGSARDPQGNGQNLSTLLGKLLRIDVSGAAYKVPPDNPFVGRQGARGEIWAYGLRNPWRFSFDKTTGALWLADVGQDAREEVDIITRGSNYGWSVMEGSQCLGSGTGCNQSGLIPPIIDYANAGNDCSITGGFVYRGNAFPALQGAYVYADYCSGKIWGLRAEVLVRGENVQIGSAGFNVSSFAQGTDGEIYVLQHSDGGGIFQVIP